MSFHYPINGGGGGGGVTSLNTLTGALNLIEGDGIDINASGSDITISTLGASVDNTTLEVKVATTAALPGTPTYNNGTAGVGATLTRSSNGTTGTIDGITAANLMVGDRILVKNQSAQLQNGIYEVTQQGSASLPYILTRTADADTKAEMDDMVVVASSGTTNKGVPFGQQTNNPTIGTNNIVFTSTGIYVKQKSSGTQAVGQIPYYTATALTLTKGDTNFTRNTSTQATLMRAGTATDYSGITFDNNDTTLRTLFNGGADFSQVRTGTSSTSLTYSVGGNGNTVTLDGSSFGVLISDGVDMGSIGVTKDLITFNSNYSFPKLDGTSGQTLVTDGSGTLSWATAGGGGTPAGSSNQIQINQGGAFFADSTFQKSDTDFNVGLDHTQQSAVSFTGSGLDDLTVSGTFSGTYPTIYTVTIDGVNKDVLSMESSAITGGTFAVSDVVTNGLGGTATVTSVVEVARGVGAGSFTYLGISISAGTFGSGETIDNGTGVTGTGDFIQVDTFTFTDGTITYSNAPTLEGVLLSNSILALFNAETGHTLTESWTWDYSTVNQNVLDFSNNDYKFQATFGTDTFGYQISDNLLGLGYEGSAMTLSDGSGNSGFRGLYIETGKGDIYVADNITLSDGTIVENKIDISSTASVTYAYNGTSFLTGTSVIASDYINIYNDVGAGNELGFFVESGTLLLGNRNGGNNTKITIDDVNEHITISNLPAYDDDTAAGVGGLTAGMVYMTTGSGSAPLNAAGILMIKQ